jgi:DNA polymerase III delta prime subunit
METITQFIKDLETLSPKVLSNLIYNFNSFKSALKKLDSMIGMNSVKKTVISQIKYYLINKSKNTSILDNYMFHTTVLGPPGCGKTTLVEILAELWICLGLIKINNTETSASAEALASTKVINPENNKMIADNLKLINELLSQKSKLDKVKRGLIADKNKISNLKKAIINTSKNIPEKDVANLVHTTDRIIASINKNIKNLYDKPAEIHIEKVEETDYVNDEDELMEEHFLEPKVPGTKSLGDSVPGTKSLGTQEQSSHPETFSFTPSQYVVKLKRDDLVGKYVGHTAIKTKEALAKGLDKIIFIDEAYELYNNSEGSSDSFGMECLNAILSFMNENSHRCIFIFAGYENLLKETIFKVQPGLERRIQWNFLIEKNSIKEIVEIYDKQLKEKHWQITDKSKLVPLFEKNKELFKFGGGDTLRLCLYTKTVYSEYSFKKLLSGETLDSVISYNIVKDAIEMLRSSCDVHNDKTKSEPPFGMYL